MIKTEAIPHKALDELKHSGIKIWKNLELVSGEGKSKE
jgi:hypothetical protein